MIAYDRNLDPPAPYLQVTAASTVRVQRYEVMPALLDTGSDITAIPRRLVDSLRLYPIGRLQLEDVEAKTSPVFTYAVRLTIVDVTIPRLEVILTGLNFAVIGRDVLNRFYVLLNGPELTFDLRLSPFIS